jgi:hypothetical protein
MDPRVDLMAFINELFCTYDEIGTKENLAINDLICGLRGYSPKFNKFAQGFDDFVGGMHQQFMKTNEFFNERNWWYLHCVDVKFALRACRAEVDEDSFNQMLVEHFKENEFHQLKKVVGKWSKFGLEKPLYPMINQVISAHMRGEYYLTVAAMIPVIEHLLIETHNDYYGTDNHKLNSVKKEIMKDFQDDKIYYANFLFMLKMVYKDGDFNELDDFNRHKIVHGKTLEYGKEIYSLKLLLAIDEMIRFRYLIQTVKMNSHEIVEGI